MEIERPLPSEPVAYQAEAKYHIGSVDHLRGLAALFVCLFHFSTGTLRRLHNAPMHELWSWGYNGVTIFFVISGFVIPYAMLRSRYRLRDFWQFLGKRFVRIGPPSWVAMGLTLVQWWLANRFLHAPLGEGKVITVGTVLLNMLYLVPVVGLSFRYWFNSVFWTLAVEFQFYILLAVAFPLLLRGRAWLFGLCAASLLLNIWITPALRAQMGPYGETRFVMANLPLFWLGIMLCLAMCGRLTQRDLWVCFGLLTLVAYLQMGWLRAAFGAAAFLFIRFNVFRSAITAHLGKISYSLYLIHILIGITAEGVLARLVNPVALWQQVGFTIMIIGVTVAASTVFYHWVEAPTMALARRLFRGRDQKNETKPHQLVVQ